MSSPDEAPTQRIIRLIGVYDADSTMRGEVAYWIGARLGRRHCSLCDITHGSVRERPEWKSCRAGLPVPFDTYHRNDQPNAVLDAADGNAPVVVAETNSGVVALLSPADLAACGGSIDRLVDAIERAADRADLTWAVTDQARAMTGNADSGGGVLPVVTDTDANPAHPSIGSGEIVVYSRPGCPFCSFLRHGLRRAGLSFREVNIWHDPQAAAFVRSVARGNETVPTVSIGALTLVNPSARRVLEVATNETPACLPSSSTDRQ